ncbi:uncharacterized protein BO66DRAFT_434833 [Aspergillus aculeatinus CBS 121060]|uniref:Uncharacterized protein n=1 Tax=Aspergillus aculeatinus CBS 121060 TaxID=1448322 RepID=A0ACD1HK99_9EURO|nr:hypothetical protein BO66DRAFT_434833 [Aspergillus aculeatinus CBS 121060]RAH73840.1 hypothetical protein BO66DRAFT_434833 [Aspergillus aculeatinus CBS 121060]
MSSIEASASRALFLSSVMHILHRTVRSTGKYASGSNAASSLHIGFHLLRVLRDVIVPLIDTYGAVSCCRPRPQRGFSTRRCQETVASQDGKSLPLNSRVRNEGQARCRVVRPCDVILPDIVVRINVAALATVVSSLHYCLLPSTFMRRFASKP